VALFLEFAVSDSNFVAASTAEFGMPMLLHTISPDHCCITNKLHTPHPQAM